MSILNDMGNTPLVKLKNPFGDNYAQVYLKMEEFNPGGSIKSRVALQMIEDAEIAGILNPGATLIEPTGGNTGIGLAVACSLKGYQLVLTIDHLQLQVRQKRRLILKFSTESISLY